MAPSSFTAVSLFGRGPSVLYRSADELELVGMICSVRAVLAEVDHIWISNSGPKLRLFCQLLTTGQKIAESIGTETHCAEKQQPMLEPLHLRSERGVSCCYLPIGYLWLLV
jgi:hypothetical protein